MFSTEAKKHADACRFCWMCRHLCPIGLQTGRETNTPRAKGLMVSLVERGYQYTTEMVADMYECCLCNACTNDCVTGFEPPMYIREARTMALVENLVPEHVRPVIDKLFATGNLFGASMPEVNEALRRESGNLPATAKVVLHLGVQTMVRMPSMVRSAVALFRKANIDFTILVDEAPSGCALGDMIGYTEEVRSVAAIAAGQINATGAETLVVLDPSDARLFKHEYPAWGCALVPNVVTATAYFNDLVSRGVLKPSPLGAMKVSFHDPCRLARDLHETEEARHLIEAMGLELHEMFLHGEMTKCCGGEVLKSHSPHLAAMTADGRWQDFSRTGADVLLTACPGCSDVLGCAVPPGKALEDLFGLLAKACHAV